MSTKFRTVITTAGAAKLAAATAPGGRKVNITTMAVGDGGGKLPVPDAGQTGLIHEVWRHALNKISQTNETVIILSQSWLFRRRWAVSGCVNLACTMMRER